MIDKIRNMKYLLLVLIGFVGFACIPLVPEGTPRMIVAGATVVLCSGLWAITQTKKKV